MCSLHRYLFFNLKNQLTKCIRYSWHWLSGCMNKRMSSLLFWCLISFDVGALVSILFPNGLFLHVILYEGKHLFEVTIYITNSVNTIGHSFCFWQQNRGFNIFLLNFSLYTQFHLLIIIFDSSLLCSCSARLLLVVS